MKELRDRSQLDKAAKVRNVLLLTRDRMKESGEPHEAMTQAINSMNDERAAWLHDQIVGRVWTS